MAQTVLVLRMSNFVLTMSIFAISPFFPLFSISVCISRVDSPLSGSRVKVFALRTLFHEGVAGDAVCGVTFLWFRQEGVKEMCENGVEELIGGINWPFSCILSKWKMPELFLQNC